MSKLELKVVMAMNEKVVRPLKSILEGSSGTAKALKGVREQLKALNDEQGKIDRFNKTVAASREASAAYKKQKESLDALVEKTNAARASQSEMVGAIQVARREHNILRKAFAKNDQTPGLGHQLFESKRALEKLETEYRKAINTTRRLKEEVRDETRVLDAAKQRKDSYKETLKRFSGELKEAGIGTKNLAERHAKLAASIEKANTAAEKHGKIMQRLSAARAEYARRMEFRDKAFNAGASSAAAGAAIGMPILKTVKEFAIAEDAATQLKVAMMGVGGKVPDEFKRINDLAGDLGNRLPGTTADYQSMMTMLIKQGMSAKAILGGLGEATAFLGVQLKMPMEAAAEFASKLQDATRTAEGDMMRLMDVIQRTSYLGVDSENMLAAFTKLSPAMSMIKQQGLDAAKAFAPLIVMADQAGMSGEQAGNAYRKVFQYALDAKKLGKANDALDGTGITLDFSNGRGEFGGMDKLFANIDKLKSLNTMKRNSVLKELFGDDAETLQVVSLIIDRGKAGYEEVQAKMAAQADIQRRVNEQLGTLQALWDAASGTFTNAMAAWGEAIAPEVKAITKWIGEMSEGIGNFAKEHPALAGFIMKTAAVVALLLAGFGALTLAAAAVLGPLAMLKLSMSVLSINGFGLTAILSRIALTILPLVSSAVWTLGAAIMFTPIGWLLAGIAALATSALLIYKYWEPIKAFFGGFWDGLSAVFGPALQQWWGAFKGLVSAVAGLLGIISTPLKALIDIASYLFGWLLNLIEPVKNTGDAARGMGESVGMAVGNILSAILYLPTKFFELGSAIMRGLGNGILSAFGWIKGIINKVGDLLPDSLKKKLGIHSPSRVFAELGGFTMQGLSNGLQDGQRGPLDAVRATAKQLAAIGAGMAIGGGAFAGEPPIKWDTRPPISQSQAAAAAATTTTNYFTINAAPGMNEQQLAQLVAREIDRLNRQQAANARSSLRDKE